MRYLAIDYGNRRTGLAVCDPSETIVSPLTVYETNKNLIQKIQGPQARRTIGFSKELQAKIQLPIHFQDERLSSFTAREKMAEAELTKKKKKKRLDAVAAAQILEAFLEKKRQEEQDKD
jgi:putative Holliday junction resolvase